MRRQANESKRGSALIVSLLFMFILGSLALSLVAFGGALHKEHKQAREATKSFYVAEAGLNEAYAHLLTLGEADLTAMEYPRRFDAGTYAVETTLGWEDPELRLDRIRLRSAGTGGATPEGVELTIWKVPTGFFRWAVFGNRQVTLNSNVYVDSFDSENGPYSEDDNPGDFGNVGSNGDIEIRSNTIVHGDAVVGPSGILDDSAPQIEIHGVASALEEPEEMDPIAIPAIPVSGPLNVLGNTTLASGDYHFSNFTLNGGARLIVEGPARLVLDSAVAQSNSELIIDSAAGQVEIYATGDFDLRSNSTITTTSQRSRDLSIFIASSNLVDPGATITFDSNAELYGTIYAPNAALDISSNFTIFGALRAEEVELQSSTSLHFDEDLLYDDGVPALYERAAWRRLSASEVRQIPLQ